MFQLLVPICSETADSVSLGQTETMMHRCGFLQLSILDFIFLLVNTVENFFKLENDPSSSLVLFSFNIRSRLNYVNICVTG